MCVNVRSTYNYWKFKTNKYLIVFNVNTHFTNGKGGHIFSKSFVKMFCDPVCFENVDPGPKNRSYGSYATEISCM